VSDFVDKCQSGRDSVTVSQTVAVNCHSELTEDNDQSNDERVTENLMNASTNRSSE